jgi:Uma2 family endonuclease
MATNKPLALLHLEYANAAEAYLRSLPPEHFMEATPQATQREITVESLALVKAQRPEVQYFNELLVQYPYGRPAQIQQVVPDNLVVVHPEPIQAEGSFDVPLQPVRPFWVLEYVSKHSQRKDYEDNFVKYERELKVSYFMLFYPDNQDLTLFRHTGRKYHSVTANEAGRHSIPELELELALLDGWVRFWFRDELLPLPADLQRQLSEMRRQLQKARKQARQAEEQARQAEEQTRQAEELARKAQQQADKAQQQADRAQQKADRAQQQAEQERLQKERLLAQLRELGIEPQL